MENVSVKEKKVFSKNLEIISEKNCLELAVLLQPVPSRLSALVGAYLGSE